MSENWKTQQEEEKEHILVGLKSLVERAETEADDHRVNARLGTVFAGLAAIAMGVEEYFSRKWGFNQDLITAAGSISLGAASIESWRKRVTEQKAFDAWQQAVHIWIEDD